ncbi:MAG TPA: hypothetical protein VGE07_00175 [Herpetosiphonaceae bacterium]
MITTVTTTTTTAVAAVSAGSLALVAICTVLILLINKEIILSSQTERAVRLNKALNVALVPLLIVFVLTLVIRIAQTIS